MIHRKVQLIIIGAFLFSCTESQVMSIPINSNKQTTAINQVDEKTRQELKQLVDELANTYIKWDGQYIGIVATPNNSGAKRLMEIGEPAIPDLIAALQDESKFAAAHVILTYISKVQFTTIPWNELEVDLSADGNTRFNVNQRFDLAKKWHQWYTTIPRPTTLTQSNNQN